MKGWLAGVAAALIIIGALLTFSPALGRLAVGCTGDAFMSGIFTGRVTDAATGLGVIATLSWVDPPYSNSNAGGTIADSSGYYYRFSMGPVGTRFMGCDEVQVTITKTGYDVFTTTFQLPDNACTGGAGSCNSFTYGANYAVHQSGSNPLKASFTYVASSLTVSFTDRTTGMPTSWNWNFGDGYTSAQQNPTHTYAAGGTGLNVTLTAYRASDGVSSTASVLINVAYGGTSQGQTQTPSCPTGYSGTYPNCMPPPYNPGQDHGTGNNTGNNTTPPPTLTAVQWVGIGVVVVGLVMAVVSGMLPGIIFTTSYVHPEDMRRERR